MFIPPDRIYSESIRLLIKIYDNEPTEDKSLLLKSFRETFLGTDDIYKPNLSIILNSFSNFVNKNNNKSKSYWLWLLGRVLIAHQVIESDLYAMRIANLMEFNLQNTRLPNDVYLAWAWSYLLIYFAKCKPINQQYYMYQDTWLKIIENLPKQPSSDLLWAYVMALLVAAEANDEKVYQNIIAKIQDNVNAPSSLAEAISAIPESDYTAWALSIAYFSATRFEDKVNAKLLADNLQDFINHTKNKYDKKLAISYQQLTQLNIEWSPVTSRIGMV